jgi:hypothetical protein
MIFPSLNSQKGGFGVSPKSPPPLALATGFGGLGHSPLASAVWGPFDWPPLSNETIPERL